MLSTTAIRLDEIRHPFGPCPAALDAAASPTGESVESLTCRLRQRLSDVYRVSVDSILLIREIDCAVARVAANRNGAIVTFAPSAGAERIERLLAHHECISIVRGFGRNGMLDVDVVADLPNDATAYIDSPSDPLGTLLRPADAVRLARAVRRVVVDERHVEFAGQSLLAVAAEFDNLVVCRSFESWAGLGGNACAWVVANRRLINELQEHVALPAASELASALATLENMAVVDTTMRLVREERSRLFRMLRKFSYFEPLPSWGPFVTARVSIGSRDHVVEGLKRRGVLVHAPTQSGLESYIRFGIGTRTTMERLRCALVDLAPEVIEATSRRGSEANGLPLCGEELVKSEGGQVEQLT